MQQQSTSSGANASSLSDAVTVPSPPTERELAILQRVLGAVHAVGIEQLRDQVRMLQVAPGSDPTCRIYLVHPDAPRAGFSHDGRGKLCSVPVRSPQGRILGEVGVWVEHGHLRALHYIRHDAHPALVLPPPDWVELPAPSIPASARVPGPLQALAAVRLLGAAPVLDGRARTVQRGRRAGQLVGATLALCVLALALAAFLVARAGGTDLDAARTAGAAAGSAAGARHGEIAGTFIGATEGERAGHASTYQATFTATRARRLATARREALERRRAAEAAAAAAPVAYVDNTSCAGFRDARGYWICS